MAYIVVSNADAGKCNEALGRLYAQSLSEPYPIPGRFTNGEINPDPEAATRFYASPQPGVNGTHTAFNADATVQGWLGQTVTTSTGDFTVPSSTQELAENWFPEP